MKVCDIMNRPPEECHTSTTLSTASRHMRDRRCGTLVVMNPRGRLAGIVTDRDLALAISDIHGPPSRVTVDHVMTRDVHTCGPDDDIQTAIAQMSRWKVRRLPVVDSDGDVKGMISIDDIVLWGIHNRGVGLREATRALRSIVAASETMPEPDGL
jgi:CBS domain-containing protein